MTSILPARHGRLLAFAFSLASTCISFGSTLELLNLQSGRPAVVLETDMDPMDI